MKLLEVNNLSIGYGMDRILSKSINLSLLAGQFVGLVGQNGVGKSTFIRTISGLQPKLDGEVRISGVEVSQQSLKDMAKKVSVVLTGKPESLNLSVLELVALGRHPYSGWLGTLQKDDLNKIEEAISMMEVNYLAKKRLYELSDGQLQKVMIARALAQETDIIILDEPTSHLDLKNKIEVLKLLNQIASTGKAILISTHEVQLSAKECDLFWCMDFKKKMLVGEPHELISSGQLQDYLHIEKEILL
ncbi:MAG: ABC transporter ATP-binding protein [Bacteroidota bacterium]